MRAGDNTLHLHGHTVNREDVLATSQYDWVNGPRQSLGDGRSSQGHSRQMFPSASDTSLARKDLKTREAVNRDQKIKQEDPEIEERIELNGESQISESTSKRSLLSFL